MNKNWLVGILMLIHLGLTFYVSSVIMAGIPHMPDSAAYYRQAILLSQGKLYQANFTMEPREAFIMMSEYFQGDNLFVRYPHFWPFLMAVFIKLGTPSLSNPFFSTLSLLLIFLISRRLFDEKTGLIAALLYCVSPIVILMASEYMMHTVTQFFLLASFYFLLKFFDSKSWHFGFLGGLSIGYAFALRPLTTAGVFLPIGLYFLFLRRKEILALRSLWLVAGFLVLMALLVADNHLLTGEYSKFGHPTAIFRDSRALVSPSNLQTGLNMTDSTFAYLSPIIFYSFIPHIILALALIPVFFIRKKEDFLCILIFISLVGFYSMIYTHGIHGYGPRYFFESFFALFILAARGILWLVGNFTGVKRKLVVGFLVVLLLYNIYGLATILPKYKDYNFIPTETFEKLKSLDLANSIVIIGKTWDWFEDGLTSSLYDPEYKKSFFIRETDNGTHLRVLENYPERKAYIIKDRFTLVEFNRSAFNASG
jgi:4-amino-4-deoxy-L-arabinose transferase-like glycosyltransferase